MKKIKYAILLSVVASLLTIVFAVAQTGQLALSLSRDWGYGGFNGDIQGLFTIHVTGPSDLSKVVFYIDGSTIGEVDKAPFNLQFNTDNYPLGEHAISAVGTSTGGQEYRSNVARANFVPATQGSKTVFVILGVVLLAVLISATIPFLASRRKVQLPLGSERKYGISGGAICPNCHRPFALPLITAHVGFSKIAVCPYCGKLGTVKPESLENLRKAEKAELGWAQPGTPSTTSDEEQLKKDLDNSKYQGL
ncbi:MAG TPA: Ig-like domain-containing protein [Anaerolineales bacterium]|nr:Ig-like domain-containing protein [Anaerolineales bacterium]